MIRKKVDQRIKTVIDNSIIQNHRSFFVVIGDKGREQIVNLHRILTNAAVESQPSVLWCYKKELGFTANRQKRMSIMKKKQKQGQLDKEDQNVDSFELFLTTTQIRWAFYKETHKILGSTFGMLVLQDFEAITPNILARTVETVSGGGIVVMLLKTMSSLKQLYSLAMDQHNKFRTESHNDVVPRFNERFLLSLIDCETSLFMDDELNILPISLSSRKIVPIPPKQTGDMSADEKELLSLKETLLETPIVGSLLKRAKTLDQGKALIHFFEAISEKTLRNTVALTAGRGRGKSAALGLAIAGAVAYGYANIFVTSPSPENLQTLFQFVMSGFDQLEYKEHTDYELVQSTNPGLKNVIVRINIFRSHRQVIQYILPTDCAKLGQAELLVIDEAAAIPLPYVRALLGPYLVFMSSTINGYEGTGRSLSLKLIKELKERGTNSVGGRTFREIELKDPIRYSVGDSVEKWLNQLLCLDCTEAKPISACPLPSQCELYYVNRNTLFSYHKISEKFLHDAMSLYVSSHYKNSPNDLMLISDAPGHHLFVLLPPTTDETSLPDILCVVQISLEGAISKESVFNSLSRGKKPNGDLIPWTINQQFQDDDFPSLSGARIVRIATHPQVQKMGYGTRAVEQLVAYFEGKIGNLDENNTQNKESEGGMEVEEEKGDLYSEKKLRPKKNLPPLLMKLSERPPESLHYIGTSFGMTQQLFSFWKKVNFLPVYLRQTELEITGEHSCIMLRNLNSSLYPQNYNVHWRDRFHEDFASRFASLLGFAFKKFPVQTALQVLAKRRDNAMFVGTEKKDYFGHLTNISKAQIDMLISPYDLKRLDQYVENLIDHHAIMDLVPTLAKINFVYGFSEHVVLSQVQYCILLGIGLQYKQFEDISKDLNIQINQVMALYKKAIKKFVVAIKSIEEKAEEKLLPESSIPEMKPNKIELDDELNEAAGVEMQKEQRRNLLDGLVSPDFVIQNDKSEWDQSTSQLHSKVPNIISVKRKKMDSPHATKETVLEKDKNLVPEGVTGKFKPDKKKKTYKK